MTQSRASLSDFVMLTTLAAIFGASFVFTRVAVRDIPPLTIAAGRILIAFVLLYVFMRIRGQRLPRGWRLWLIISAASFFGYALPFVAITWGQVKVDAGLTAILMAVMPLITIILAHYLTTDEHMNRYKLIGVLVGLLGVTVLIGWDKLGQLGDDLIRQYAIGLGAVSYAFNAILTKHLTNVPRFSMMAALMLAAVIMLVPISLWIDQPFFGAGSEIHWSASAMLAMLTLAIGPTAIATLLILNIIARQGASFLSQINFMVPLFGVLFGAVFLQERLPASAWIALALILLGIAVSRFGNLPTRPKAK